MSKTAAFGCSYGHRQHPERRNQRRENQEHPAVLLNVLSLLRHLSSHTNRGSDHATSVANSSMVACIGSTRLSPTLYICFPFQRQPGSTRLLLFLDTLTSFPRSLLRYLGVLCSGIGCCADHHGGLVVRHLS